MIEIGPDDYVLGIWYMGGRGQDWLAAGKREGNEWVLRYRFRYYAPERHNPRGEVRDPWDGRDEKSWFTVRAPLTEPEDRVIAKLELIVRGMEMMGYLAPGQTTWRMIVKGVMGDEGMKEFFNAPFVHWKAEQVESTTTDAPVSAKRDRGRKSAKRRKR